MKNIQTTPEFIKIKHCILSCTNAKQLIVCEEMIAVWEMNFKPSNELYEAVMKYFYEKANELTLDLSLKTIILN